jgi:hypothetical protein
MNNWENSFSVFAVFLKQFRSVCASELAPYCNFFLCFYFAVSKLNDRVIRTPSLPAHAFVLSPFCSSGCALCMQSITHVLVQTTVSHRNAVASYLWFLLLECKEIIVTNCMLRDEAASGSKVQVFSIWSGQMLQRSDSFPVYLIYEGLFFRSHYPPRPGE